MLRVRDRDRGLRLMFRSIHVSSPEQRFGQLGADPAFGSATDAANGRAYRLLQRSDGFVRL